jgi:hypothetical protein
MFDCDSLNNWYKWAEIEKDGLIETHSLKLENGKYQKLGVSHDQDCATAMNRIAGPYLHCVGVNPRPEMPIRQSAHDSDIRIYKNVYFDFEPIHESDKSISNTAYNSFKMVFQREIFHSIFGIFPSIEFVIAYSGNGVHCLCAIPERYQNYPTLIRDRLSIFYKQNLHKIPGGIRWDSTFSPSRQVKVYGTAKPVEGSRVSWFPNVSRVEADSFFAYLFSSEIVTKEPTKEDLEFGCPLTKEEIEEKYGLE